MSNRKTEWSPWFQKMRDERALRDACRQLLALYDAGERIPPAAWEILREHLATVEGGKR